MHTILATFIKHKITFKAFLVISFFSFGSLVYAMKPTDELSWQWNDAQYDNKARLDTTSFVLKLAGKLGPNLIQAGWIDTKITPFYKNVYTKRHVLFYSADATNWQLSKCYPLTFLYGDNNNFCTMLKHDEQCATAVFTKVIYRTVDGGKTWTVIANLDMIKKKTLHAYTASAFSKNVIIISCNQQHDDQKATNSTMLLTHNGGASWKELSLPTSENVGYFYYPTLVNDSTLFVARCYSQKMGCCKTGFYVSYDRGNKWDSLGCSLEGFENKSDSIVIDSEGPIFVGNNIGYLSAKSINATKKSVCCLLFKTTNSGKHWKRILADTLCEEKGNLTDAFYLSSVFGRDTLLLVNTKGKVRKSVDGGVAWKYNVAQVYDDVTVSGGTYSIKPYFESPNYAVASVHKRNKSSVNYGIISLNNKSIRTDGNRIDSHVEEVFQEVSLDGASPHPAKDFMRVRAFHSSSANSTNTKLILYDIFGNLVRDYSVDLRAVQTSGWFTVNCSTVGLASGMYLLVIGNGAQLYSMSVCIVR